VYVTELGVAMLSESGFRATDPVLVIVPPKMSGEPVQVWGVGLIVTLKLGAPCAIALVAPATARKIEATAIVNFIIVPFSGSPDRA
jgi:hypothetical protein